MKKLLVSVKSSAQVLSNFKKALKSARRGTLKNDHFEISFDNKKDFDRFVKNLSVLSAIAIHKPKSVYELAKILKLDISNLSKLITFYETIGVLKIKTSKHNGRKLNTPIVEFQQIAFDLKAG